MVECGPGGTGWIGGECLTGGHVQAELGGLLALLAGSHAWLHPKPCHLVCDAQAPQSRHHREHDRAVAAEHQGKVAARQQRLEPLGQLPQRRSHLAGVLGQRVIPVRAPHLMRQVSVVVDLQP